VIIDTHTHVVADDQERYPLGPGYPAAWYRETPVPAELLLTLMKENGVARAILVQGFGPYKFDNRYAADAARLYPDHFASVCVVDPEDGPASRLTYWVRERGVRGVRLLPPRGRELIPGEVDPSILSIWAQALELGIPICVQIQQANIPWLRAALQRLPPAPVLLDHCGFPDISGGPPYEKAQAFWALADLPAVHLKVTSIILHQARQDGGDPRRLVDQMVRMFGADRLMWGSDYSQTNHLNYQQHAELGRRSRSGLSSRNREWFEAGTALKFWPELRGAT